MPRKRRTKTRTAMPAHLQQRVKALQERIGGWKAQALLVTNPRDIRYLTGFVGDDSWALVPARSNQLTVLSDFRFEEQIALEAPHARAFMRKASLIDELEKLTKKHKWSRIALQSDHVTLAQRSKLQKKLGSRRITEVDDKLLEQRSVKDRQEVAAIRQALRIQQEAFKRTCRFIKAGMSEYEVAAFLEYQMRLLGADGPSFPTIVAADANASLPHAVPGAGKLRKGGMVLIDWGARFNGYCADLTRVVALGRMPAKIREIYRIVLDAQQAGIAAIRPGRDVKEVDEAARQVIEKAGYGEQFGHGLGHGIGLNIHEHPVLGKRAEGELKPGQIVTVEPGIYLPGVGGVRIEDDVQVTGTGHRVLSDLPKSLESAII